MTPIPLYTSPIVKLDGLKHIENLSACSIQVNFPNGTLVEYDLLGHPLRLSAVERLVQSLLSICLTSPLTSLGPLLDVNSLQSKHTISAVRLHRSLSSAALEGLPLSVSVTSLTTESDELSQDSGGKTTHNED
jgi:hypothetical protein